MIILTELDAQAEDGKVENGTVSPISAHNNSLWSLTLNEIELKSGKSFGSMNMDEFLTNLWNNAELDASQAVVAQPNHTNNHNHDLASKPFDDRSTQPPYQPSSQQSSLISIPSPLCKKTVDEVWCEIQREQYSTDHSKPTNNNTNVLSHERQPSLGEITLEDFLVSAGVVREARPPKPAAPAASPPQQLKSETPLGSFHGPNSSNNNNNNNFSNVGGCFASYPMMNPSNVYAGEASTVEPMKVDFDGEQSKGKIIDGPPEVLVERRQRRMIKNRESAARSRARKQAYTMELELELNYLKEENTRLKQILEIEQKAREKILRLKKDGVWVNKKTDKLRRTTSMSW